METCLTIGSLSWKVFFVKKDHSELVDDDGKQIAYGITVFRECEIYIDYELPDELMRIVITHELVHAMAFSYAIDLTTASEEEFCNFIGVHFDELKACRKTILKMI